MSDNLNFRLLALYSCGAGGLSLLTILQQFMNSVGSKPPIRPCDHFDMIGGTGAGAIIAIMLGRLQMTVSDCMNACTLLPSEAFKSRDLADPGGELWSGTGADRLEQAVVKILVERDFGKDALLRDLPDAPCKV